MLVEINLLPKKQTRNRAFFVIILALIIVTLVCFTVVYSKYSNVKAESRQLSHELSMLEKTREVLEQKISGNEDSNSVIKLEQTVNWADGYFVETVPLVQHLASLLPERGFVQSFTYVEDGIVSFIVQFDTNTEVAHYLATLNESTYLNSTKLNSITTTNFEEAQSIETTGSMITSSDEELLPRYLAQFELEINKEQLKNLQKEGN